MHFWEIRFRSEEEKKKKSISRPEIFCRLKLKKSKKVPRLWAAQQCIGSSLCGPFRPLAVWGGLHLAFWAALVGGHLVDRTWRCQWRPLRRGGLRSERKGFPMAFFLPFPYVGLADAACGSWKWLLAEIGQNNAAEFSVKKATKAANIPDDGKTDIWSKSQVLFLARFLWQFPLFFKVYILSFSRVSQPHVTTT